jgi:hypothetical protein
VRSPARRGPLKGHLVQVQLPVALRVPLSPRSAPRRTLILTRRPGRLCHPPASTDRAARRRPRQPAPAPNPPPGQPVCTAAATPPIEYRPRPRRRCPRHHRAVPLHAAPGSPGTAVASESPQSGIVRS